MARIRCVQANAANHAVREAACACIAELGLKVRTEAVGAFVPQMLDILIECFKDESWPVRDAACIALGRFIQGFPEEARGRLPELYELFFLHVCDNIWSVRENAAVALGAVVQTYVVVQTLSPHPAPLCSRARTATDLQLHVLPVVWLCAGTAQSRLRLSNPS
jgi:hypothetical protein